MTSSTKRLQDKVAVVTGGTRGLGLAIAAAFAAEGAAVIVASRSEQAVASAVAQLSTGGARITGRATDVGKLAEVEALADHAVRTFGRYDIWVNNAGVSGPYGPTASYSPADFQQVIQTNILGVYNGSRTAIQHFLARRSGKLINVLGRGHDKPVAWQNAYASSKAWAESFTLALAQENKASGAGVFAFNPGLVLTDLLTEVDVIAGSEARLSVFPTIVRMWAQPPEKPAQKVVWLASSATDGKTALVVNHASSWAMLSGAAHEGLRRLRRRPPAPIDFTFTTVPAYAGGPGGLSLEVDHV